MVTSWSLIDAGIASYPEEYPCVCESFSALPRNISWTASFAFYQSAYTGAMGLWRVTEDTESRLLVANKGSSPCS